jgi:S-adenosylmethionine-diacylglycerol 3-amino-3-carboxypropyl transferase
LQDRDREQRELFYQNHWNTWRWRLLFKLFFSRTVIGRFGRDPEFFKYVHGSVGARILERAARGFTETPTHTNPYLCYILTGNYRRQALPRYLRKENFEHVRAGIDRLTLKLGAIDEVASTFPAKSFDGFNLSDIFEYLDENLTKKIYATLIQSAKPGARLAYWNMLVPRSCPTELISAVRPLENLSAELFQRDKAFFYSAFLVEEVI